jgi:hypothetical protein
MAASSISASAAAFDPAATAAAMTGGGAGGYGYSSAEDLLNFERLRIGSYADAGGYDSSSAKSGAANGAASSAW